MAHTLHHRIHRFVWTMLFLLRLDYQDCPDCKNKERQELRLIQRKLRALSLVRDKLS